MDFIHHILDIWPEPREAAPRFINESWLIDSTVDIVAQFIKQFFKISHLKCGFLYLTANKLISN